MADYQVTIGERTIRVTLRRADNRVLARIDDADEVAVEMTTVGGVLRSLAIGDSRTELLAARAADGAVAMSLGGIGFRAEVVDEAHARLASVAGARSSSSTRSELKAPMPGLVVRVLCEVGDEVAPSQPLAVLQAMKMENELAVPRGGKVSAINVTAGQTVEQGQVLLVVETD
jgi:biotin carboxyl carrier protein